MTPQTPDLTDLTEPKPRRPRAALAIFAVALMTALVTAPAAIAGTGVEAERSTAKSVTRVRATTPKAPSGDLFDALEEREDPLLETVRAKGLTGSELLISVIFLIFLFPVGVILLIVFAITDEDKDVVILDDDEEIID